MGKEIILKCIDAVAFFVFTVARKPYSEYYAFRMNLIIKLNPNWGKNLEREFQLDYLKKKGLTPESILLDYGCGALSAGRYFVDYLNEDCYVGADVALSVIDEGKRRLKVWGLEGKGVRLVHVKNNHLPIDRIGRVDFVWAQSVVTHMSPDDLSAFISQLDPIVDKGSKIFFSFTMNENGVRHRKFKDWEYDLETIVEISKKYNFRCELQNDWVHPYDTDGTDKIVCLSFAG